MVRSVATTVNVPVGIVLMAFAVSLNAREIVIDATSLIIWASVSRVMKFVVPAEGAHGVDLNSTVQWMIHLIVVRVASVLQMAAHLYVHPWLAPVETVVPVSLMEISSFVSKI